MPEKRKDTNKTYSVDLADSIGASYVPSPCLCATRRDREAPYEARKDINIGLWFSFFSLLIPFNDRGRDNDPPVIEGRVKIFRGDSLGTVAGTLTPQYRT